LEELSDRIADAIPLEAPVSIYAQSSGGSSAHEIHKNSGNNGDGAIVINASQDAPVWLLFHFADQAF
jgi:hypothetical protein